MSTDTFSRTGAMGTSEKAKLAVAEFRRMLPTLSSYARALTGKDDVQVVMSGWDNGSTDGHKIFFRPPIELAEQYEHDRRLCDRRTPSGLQECDACRVREEILSVIYHEIAHIAYDSFRKPRGSEILHAVNTGFAGRSDEWSKRKANEILTAPTYTKNSWMQLAALISSYSPMLVNCLEDARVNKAMFEARVGIKTMFQATVDKIFTDGFEASDGMGGVRTVRWNEQPLNSQVMVGVFCKVSGYDYGEWFSPSVIDALNDRELSIILAGMKTVRTAANVYTLSIPTLVRLRELGFLLEPEEMESEEPEESESGEDENPEEGESSVPGATDDGEDEPESDDSDEGADGSAEGDSASGDSGDEAGDDTDDDAPDGSGSEDASVEHSSGSGGDESASAGHSGSDDPTEDDLPDGEGGESEGVDDSERDEDRAGGTTGSTSPDDTHSERSESEESDEEQESSPLHEEKSVSEDDSTGESSEEADDDADPSAVRLIDNHENDDKPIEPDYGTPEDVETALLKFGEHDTPPTHVREGETEDAIDVAVIQGIYFETESRNIRGVRFHPYEKGSEREHDAWSMNGYNSEAREADLTTSESIIGKALLQARRVFEDNARAKQERNRKNGRVNARALGRRAPFDDERLFKKRTLPGKKDYFVVIGVDVSGSTVGRNIVLEKQAVAAQAELLHRLGVKFAIFAHSGDYHDYGKGRSHGIDLDIYPIKEGHEPWDTKSKERLQKLGSASANLDGHALEFLRKRADESRATDKIILYYSDGQMPAENRDEELIILQREIRTCRSKGYTLLGVGIRTDSPKAHGLDTVRVNTPADLSRVIEHLEKRLV